VRPASPRAPGAVPRPLRAPGAHAEKGYPHEVCGLFLGALAGGTRRVEEVLRATNIAGARAADRYELEPLEYLAAEERARALGLAVVGVYHAHPDHPAVPSETDRLRAAELWGATESWSYLILEVVSGKVTRARSWIFQDGSFREDPLGVRDPGPGSAPETRAGHEPPTPGENS
jgi:proteasome lid subunit RPN8/RPN11